MKGSIQNTHLVPIDTAITSCREYTTNYLLQQRPQRQAATSSRRHEVEIGQLIWESDQTGHETVIAGMFYSTKNLICY